MAEAGGTRKVAGNRMATPLTEPRPGMAPMNRPSVTPMKMRTRFSGCTEMMTPVHRCPRISTMN